MAVLSMAKGLYHWAVVSGVTGPPDGFEYQPTPWQTATIFFAVIDLVAAVGLWLAAAWGGVVWLTAAISIAAVEIAFSPGFWGGVWVAVSGIICITVFIAPSLIGGGGGAGPNWRPAVWG